MSNEIIGGVRLQGDIRELERIFNKYVYAPRDIEKLYKGTLGSTRDMS
jgi:hypothetical protein